jgi:hypothetical protein
MGLVRAVLLTVRGGLEGLVKMTYTNEGQTPFSLGDLSVPHTEARKINRRYYGLGLKPVKTGCRFCGRKSCKGNCRGSRS